jgi:hypothetical protein
VRIYFNDDDDLDEESSDADADGDGDESAAKERDRDAQDNQDMEEGGGHLWDQLWEQGVLLDPADPEATAGAGATPGMRLVRFASRQRGRHTFYDMPQWENIELNAEEVARGRRMFQQQLQ